MKMPEKCMGPKSLSENLRKWGTYLGRHDLLRRVDRQGEVLIWCKAKNGTQLVELLQAGASVH